MANPIPTTEEFPSTSTHQRRSKSTATSSGNTTGGNGKNLLEAKVVILGTQGVGKTSLVHRYTSGHFNPSSIPSTIGASFLVKKLVVDGVKVRLQIWDTAGQERFRSMAPMYYRGSSAALIVYDITSLQSFLDVKTWIEELRRNMKDDLIMMIVGAKSDLEEKREISLEDARRQVGEWIWGERNSGEDDKADGTATTNGRDGRGTSRLTNTLSGLGSLKRSTNHKDETLGGPNSPTRNKDSMVENSTNSRSIPSTFLSSNQISSNSSNNMTSSSASAHFNNLDFIPPNNASDLSSQMVQISEVSSKESVESIENIFLNLTTKLVERKTEIERERRRKERESILVGDDGYEGGRDRDGNAAGDGNGGEGNSKDGRGWSCC